MLVRTAYTIRAVIMRRLSKITFFQIRLGVFVLAAYWLLIFAGTHLPKLPAIAADVSDKAKHFTAFFGLTLLLCYVTTSPKLGRRFAWIGSGAACYAAVDELTQMLVPGRTADVWDFAADSLGIAVALFTYYVARLVAWRWFPRFVQPAG